MNRLSKQAYYLNIALAVAERSTCLKKQFGAVIVKDDAVIATGYNGSPCGEPHCTVCTKKSGKDGHMDFDEYYACSAVHAEMNAIIRASGEAMKGATLYLAGYDADSGKNFKDAAPCEICLRLIKNSGIAQVITERGIIFTRDSDGLLLPTENHPSYFVNKN